MEKFTYTLSLEAEGEQQALEKMAALALLAKKLKPNELKKIAQIVAENGDTFKMAKKFLGF